MLERLSSRVHFAVFAPDISYTDGFPAAAAGAYLQERVSGGKTLAAFNVALPSGGGFDEPTEYETHFRRYLADGSLDRTFGRNGTLNVGQTRQVRVVPGSRIFVLPDGGTVLRAYTLNGRVDATFGGGDGIADIPVNAKLGNGTFFNDAYLAGVTADGRPLTQATVDLNNQSGSPNRHTVALLNTDGSLDPNFGYKGLVSFQDIGSDLTPLLTDRALYLLIDRIGATDPPSADIIKLSPDGKTADTTFGGDGRVAIPGFVSNLTEQADGKLLFLDRKYDDDHTLYRLNLNGTADTSFSNDGKVFLAYTGSDAGLPLNSVNQRVIIDNQNRILVSADKSIFRLSTSGALDTYPYNGTVPFPTSITSLDDAGGIIGLDRKRYALVTPQQLDRAGIVQIASDARDDVITIGDAGGGKIRVIVNGESKLFRGRDVKGFNAQTFDGRLTFRTSFALPVTLSGGNGDADLTLGDGNDDIKLGIGDHTIALGGGDDQARVGDTPPVDAETDPNAGDRQTITGTGGNKKIEFLNGSAAITLAAGDHEVSGYREVHDSVIDIAGGNNTVRLSGIGGDTITIGGRGRNSVTVFGEETRVATGAGPDEILAISPTGTFDTGRGNDVVTIRNFTESPTRGVTVNGGEGDDHVLCDNTYNSLATVYGGGGNDLLEGNTLSQRLYGQAGDDTLSGGDGNDYLYGGAGDDLLLGGAQSDRLYGEAGYDRLYGQAGNDTLSGGDDNDRLYAESGSDILYGDAGIDRLYAANAAGHFAFYGGTGRDLFYTRNNSRDTIHADADDSVVESDADDVLST